MGKMPRINVYQCEYGCQTVTVDVDKGVTPFAIKCCRKPTAERPMRDELVGQDGECIGDATSSFYPKNFVPEGAPTPTHEWYLPTLKQAKRKEKNAPGTIDHVQRGGMLLRPRTTREPIYHE